MTKGVPPQAGSGHSPKGGAASSTASPAQPSVPNAVGFIPIPVDPDLLFCDLAEEGAAAGLLALMTGISEEYWCAGWMTGLEYSLWDRVETGPSRYGQGFVTQQQCDLLHLLSQEADGWWYWCEEPAGPRFVRSKEWAVVIHDLRAEFAASCDTHPKGGDVKQAPSLMGSAVPSETSADAQEQPLEPKY